MGMDGSGAYGIYWGSKPCPDSMDSNRPLGSAEMGGLSLDEVV